MIAYIMLADGFEEIEALTPVDILRRGDVKTVMVSVEGAVVESSHGIKILADDIIERINVGREDIIILPGGSKGVKGLEESEKLIALIKEHNDQRGLLAAICAGPSIPGKLGFYKGIKAVCYPGWEGNLHGAIVSNEDVVADNNHITARGAGVSLPFAFAILDAIRGSEITEKIKSAMLYNS